MLPLVSRTEADSVVGGRCSIEQKEIAMLKGKTALVTGPPAASDWRSHGARDQGANIVVNGFGEPRRSVKPTTSASAA